MTMEQPKEQQEQSFDEVFAQAQSLIERLRRGEGKSFEAMIEDVERAAKLLEQCRQKLTDTEKRMKSIFANERGEALQ